MSSNKNQTTTLINQLSKKGSSVLNFSKFVDSLTTGVRSPSSNATSAQSSAAEGFQSLSETAFDKESSGLSFGKPSSSSTSTSSGISWGNLLSQSASSGVASAFTGGGLGSIGGLGGLISGIANLFGGSSSSTPPPLTLFTLPNSINQTFDVNSSTTSAQPGASASNSPVYTTPGVVNNTSHAVSVATMNTAGVAQAVKNALLTSSSLGDVIAEI